MYRRLNWSGLPPPPPLLLCQAPPSYNAAETKLREAQASSGRGVGGAGKGPAIEMSELPTYDEAVGA